MVDFFVNLNPIYQALIAGMITFFITVIGSSTVLFFKTINKLTMDIMLSIAAGIMLAASYFSLLKPAIEIAITYNYIVWLVISLGFILGGITLLFGNKLIDVFFRNKDKSNSISFKRCIMLFMAITLHNIPEGLVIGVAFGAISCGYSSADLVSAITLTIGIAIQNFPEGGAISLPLRRDGLGRIKAFLFGAISGIVEPIAAIFGALLVIKVQALLPFIMSFTAGAMIFVTIIELIPESQANKHNGIMAIFAMVGFAIMMILELIL